MPRKQSECVVVVTGASSGPGRAIALEFALRGDALALGSRREGSLDAVRRDCEALHARTLTLVTDPADLDSVRALADATVARYGRIDIWINYAPPSAARDATPADGTGGDAFDLRGYEHGASVAFDCFRAQGGGVLVNVDALVGGAPPGLEASHAQARRETQALFSAIETRGREIPGVRVASALPARTPVAGSVLAPMVASLAHQHRRGDAVGRLLGGLVRQRLALGSRIASRHRSSRGTPVLSAAGGPGSADDGGRPAKVRSGATGGAAVLETGKSRRHTHGAWHLANSASAREYATTAALLVGVPLAILAAGLMLVTG